MARIEKVLIGQSGGPTAVINASLAGAVRSARALGAPVLGMAHGIEGLLHDEVVDLDVAVPDDRSLDVLRSTPGSYLGSCRYKLPSPEEAPAVYDALLGTLDRLGVGVVAYIGGNDSMDTIDKLGRYGEAAGSPIRFMGVPKTIDNDLVAQDHTPGYGSAAKFVATCVSELACDASVYPVKSVLVVETMGRDVGWLGAASSLAWTAGSRGPDIVLVPEAPVSLDAFLDKVSNLLAVQDFVMVAVSEGARGLDGQPLYAEEGAREDAFGHAASQAGVGGFLARLVSERLGCKARGVELSTLQRCAAHVVSGRDREEAEALGALAVRVGLEGRSRGMSCLARVSDLPYEVRLGVTDVSAVANEVRQLPGSWIANDGMGVTAEFERYARPLVEGTDACRWVDGVPWHLRAPFGETVAL